MEYRKPQFCRYWKHWFSPRRLTIVQADIEENLLAREIARDFSQLVCVAVRAALSAEDSLSSEVRALVVRTELPEQELDQIGQIAEVTDEESGLLALAAFTGDPPLACFPEDGQGYPGDFPYDAMTLTPQNVRNLCTYETSTRLSQQIVPSRLLHHGSRKPINLLYLMTCCSKAIMKGHGCP